MIILDLKAQSMLLVDHKKALLWLPPGGHVEPDEDPIDAAQRELFEELSTELPLLQHAPFFLTMTETVGLTAGHTDISLWYLFQGNSTAHYAYDHSEFNAIRWFPLSDLPFERSDPHLARFCHKLQEVSSHIRTVTHDN
jgi:8-oxo-dGTP pyrophosphatase MutT (NUDIX family)